MKIEKIAFSDTAKMTVVHPATGVVLNGKAGDPMTVTLYGVQSKHYRKAKNLLMDATASNKHRKVTSAMLDESGAELLASCTVSFNGVDFGTGELDAANAKAIYVDNPWFRDQVDTFMADNERFLAK
jgi:hypothetical protein